MGKQRAVTSTSGDSDSRHNPWSQWRKRIILPAVVLLTIIVFSNSLENDFLTSWDDNQYITENSLVKELSWSNVEKIFTSFHSSGNYHPLTLLSYACEYKLFGPDPKAYHVTNLIFHCLNVILVFQLIKLITGRIETATIVALFFGIHPMHVESVSWISERKDVLYSFFLLGSLTSYTVYLKNKLKYSHSERAVGYIIALVLFVLSLLSKSAATILPLLLLLIDYYYKRRVNKQSILEKLPFFALTLIFGTIAIVSQQYVGAISNSSSAFSTIDRALFGSYAIIFYLMKACIPVNLSAFYPFPSKVDGWLPPEYYIAPIVVLAIIFTFIKVRKHQRDLMFGALFFFANIILILQIIPVGSAIVAERYTYLSFIGIFFPIGQLYCNISDRGLPSFPKTKLLFLGILTAYTLLFSVLTYERNMIWADGITLLSDVIEKDPKSGLAYLCRGITLRKQNHNGRALVDFESAIRASPNLVEAYAERGNMRAKRGEYDEAIIDFNQIIRTNPQYPQLNKVYYNRGTARENNKDYSGAIADYTHAMQIGKHDIDMYAYFSRGRAQSLLGNRAESCNDWTAAARLGHPQASDMIQKYCK